MDNRRASQLVPLGICGALALHLLLFAAALWVGVVLQPFSDMYDLVDRWFQHQEEGRLLHYLIDPHNFHRLAYTRALVALDMSALSGSSWIYVAVGLLCLSAAALLLAREAWTGAPPALRVPGALIAAMLVLSTVNALDVVFPIDTPYAEAFALGMAALIAGERRPLAAAALAILAAFGNAVALALWPVMIFGAWRAKAGRRTLLLLTGAGAVFIALYVSGQSLPGGAGPARPFDLGASVLYGLTWLGLPWSTRLGGPLIGLGMALISLAAVAFKGGPDAPPLERLAVRLILFSLGAAAMAVLGRSGFEPEIPVRYALFLTPLHLGLFFLALPWLARGERPALLAALVVALLAQQAYGVLKLRGAADQVRAALADFAAGNDTPMVRVLVHPDPARARAILVRMRAQTGRNTTFAQ